MRWPCFAATAGPPSIIEEKTMLRHAIWRSAARSGRTDAGAGRMGNRVRSAGTCAKCAAAVGARHSRGRARPRAIVRFGGLEGPDCGRKTAAQPAETSPAAEPHKKGVEAFEQGQIDAAVAFFSRSIELDPKFAPAYCDRGLAMVLKGDFDKAMSDLNTAVKLRPNGRRLFQSRFRLLSARSVR